MVYIQIKMKFRKDLFYFYITFLLQSLQAQTWTEPLQEVLQSISRVAFLPCWFDYGTYLPTTERREQIPQR